MPKSKNKRKNAGKKKPVQADAVATAGAASADSATPKVGPVKYVGQVRQEARKVVWPGWAEVYKTTILVMIMVVLMGAFFFVVDWALANIVKLVLSLGA